MINTGKRQTERIYSVGQVNNYVKNIFASDYFLKNLIVKGEVSNCKYHSSGHIYFTLKDDTGSIACVMFRTNRMAGLDFELANGQEVFCEGSVSVYERDGRYQLYAKKLTLGGGGDLFARYEALKQKLYEEGLFEFEIKKEIPPYPKRVGIVTARTGAAIEDIKNIARRRNPYVQLILYPAKVQGEGAAATIVKGIETLDKMGVDTIIIGRGGGSMEDLWAFNEEIVARAIYACKTPIISGTGHEIDTTIADYAADKRAPTPSAACELAIPDVCGVLRGIRQSRSRMGLLMEKKLSEYQMRLHGMERHLAGGHPKHKPDNQRMYLEELSDRLKHIWEQKFGGYRHKLELLTARLHGLSPTAKLVGGFGYVAEKQGLPVTGVSQVSSGDSVSVTMHDGVMHAQVTGVEGTFASTGETPLGSLPDTGDDSDR